MTEKDYMRDGKNRIIGSITNGFDDTTAVFAMSGTNYRAYQRPIPHDPRRTRETSLDQFRRSRSSDP